MKVWSGVNYGWDFGYHKRYYYQIRTDMHGVVSCFLLIRSELNY